MHEHYRAVYLIAYSHLGTRELAEDAAQETFLRAFLAREQLQQPERFAAWLCRIARNLALDWLRAPTNRRRHASVLDAIGKDEDVPDSRQPDPRQAAAQVETRRAADAMLKQLPAELREVLLLHHVEGLNFRQIGDRLAIHPTTVRYRLGKAHVYSRRLLTSGLLPQLATPSGRGHVSAAIAAAALLSITQREAAAARACAVTQFATDSVSGTAAPLLAPQFAPSSSAAFLGGLLMGSKLLGSAGAAIAAVTFGMITYHYASARHAAFRPLQAVAAVAQRAKMTPRERRAYTAPIDAALSSTMPLTIVKGTVRLPNGQPAIGGTAELLDVYYDANGQQVVRAASSQIASDGLYRVIAPQKSTFWLKAWCNDSAAAYVQITNAAKSGYIPGSLHQLIHCDVQLQPGSWISGMVLGADDEPLTGARVAAGLRHNPAMGTTFADATLSGEDGSFAMSNLPPGNGFVAASASGYVAQSRETDVPSSGTVFHLLRGGATLAGTVRCYPGGDPCSSATVTLLRSRRAGSAPLQLLPALAGVTDAQGHFAVENVPPGAYDLDARTANLRLIPARADNQYHVQLADGRTSDGTELFVYAGHALHGRVIATPGDEPLAGVTVTTGHTDDPESTRTISSADGTYRFEGFFSAWDRSAVKAIKPGYKLRSARGLTFEDMIMKPGQLDMQLDLHMAKASRIRGQILMPDGQPASFAYVSPVIPGDYDQMDHVTPVDATGHYEVDVSPNSPVYVRAGAPGYPYTSSQLVRNTQQDVDGVNITLQRGATFQGTVVDEHEAAVGGCYVDAAVEYNFDRGGRAEHLGSVSSAVDGSFTFENVPVTKVKLSALKLGYSKPKPLLVEPKPGELVDHLRIVLPPACTLTGKILSKTGEAVPNALVMGGASGLNDLAAASVTYTTADGSYALHDVPLGPIDVRVMLGSETFNFPNVESCRKSADFTIAIPTSSVEFSGTVVDEKSAKPVTEFSVVAVGDLPVRKLGGGRFVLSGIAPRQQIEFKIVAPGYREIAAGPYIAPADGAAFQKRFELGPPATVKGKLVHFGDGIPVAGARVKLSNLVEDNSRAAVLSAADGHFEISDVSPSDRRQVLIEPEPPLQALRKAITVHADVNDLGDIILSRGGSIRGVLLRAGRNEPLARATVLLRLQDSAIPATLQNAREATTDNEGGFEFNNLGQGTAVLTAPSIAPGFSTSAQVPPEGSCSVVLRVGGTRMHGRVTMAGKAQSNARLMVSGVGFSSWSGTTKADGIYEITDVPAGSVAAQVMASTDRVITMVEQMEIPDSADFEKNFELPVGIISGTVTNGAGQPEGGATILAEKIGQDPITGQATAVNVRSSEDGTYHFDNLPAGKYLVSAAKPAVGRSERVIVQLANAAAAQAPVLKLQAGGGVLISVALDFVTGLPLPGASCNVTGQDESVVSQGATRDTLGQATIENLPPGNYIVRVSAHAHKPSVQNITIRAGESTRVEDVLYPGAELFVQVMDTVGKAVAGANCTISPEADNTEQPCTGTTDSRGSWRAGALLRGSYKLSISGQGHSISKTIYVDPDNGTHQESVTLTDKLF